MAQIGCTWLISSPLSSSACTRNDGGSFASAISGVAKSSADGDVRRRAGDHAAPAERVRRRAVHVPGDDPQHLRRAPQQVGQRVAARSAGNPISSSHGSPIRIGGWCMATIVGMSGQQLPFEPLDVERPVVAPHLRRVAHDDPDRSRLRPRTDGASRAGRGSRPRCRPASAAAPAAPSPARARPDRPSSRCPRSRARPPAPAATPAPAPPPPPARAARHRHRAGGADRRAGRSGRTCQER